jgi:epoxyqueuosine reductase
MSVAGDLAERLRAAGLAAGLDVVRLARADPFENVRHDLEERKALGLNGGMAFTYRKPERSTTPAQSLPGARTLVVAARSYLGDSEDASSSGEAAGRIAKSAARDEYVLLRTGLRAMASILRAHRYRTRVLADDNALVDRAAAHRAGIGWWAKNTLIILPGAGSFFVLGSVLTDADLPVDEGPVGDRCGRCTRCMPACPTGALVAPGVLDARRCLSWLLEAPGPIPPELRQAVGNRVYGCDECQDVCPPNRAVVMRRGRAAGEAAQPAASTSVDLVEMVLAGDEELMARFGHFYLADRDPALLRRNALVALGNVASGDDPRVATALGSGLSSPNALVRAHAVWAAARLGRSDLLDSLRAGEEDELVRAELAAAQRPAPADSLSATPSRAASSS